MPSPAINFGAFAPNPGEELASAVGAAVTDMPAQQLQRQQIGQQLLQPYYQKLATDPTNPALLAKIQQISKMYGIPPLVTGTAGGSFDSQGAPAAGGTSQGQAPPAPTAGTSAPASPQPSPAGAPKPAMPFGGPAGGAAQPSNGASPQRWDDPRLQGRAQAYTALLQQAASNPSRLRDPAFHTTLIHAAAAVGRGPDEVKGDIAAYAQKVKAGIQPGGGHPAAGGAAQPPQAPQNGATAPQTPNNGQPAPQPQGASPGGAPAPAPGETQGYMNPKAASEGPLRFDVNAWLGPLSSADFASLSGMAPDERIAFLRQQGRDLNGFDQKWLHSEPVLPPADQVKLVDTIATTVKGMTGQGESLANITGAIAGPLSMLPPDQQAFIQTRLSAQLSATVQARLANETSLGMLRRSTVTHLEREDAERGRHDSIEENLGYGRLYNDQAHWQGTLAVQQENASTNAGRLQEEISRDQENAAGKRTVTPGQLVTGANEQLRLLNSMTVDYNKQVNDNTGVSPQMSLDFQNAIDSYNGFVDEMDSRGLKLGYHHWAGVDQQSIDSGTKTANDTAAGAVNSQGQTAGQPAKPKSIPGWKAMGQTADGRQVGKRNGKWVYADGTPYKP